MQKDRIPFETARNESLVYQNCSDKGSVPWAETYDVEFLGVGLHPLTKTTWRGICHAKATRDSRAAEMPQNCLEELWRYTWLSSE